MLPQRNIPSRIPSSMSSGSPLRGPMGPMQRSQAAPAKKAPSKTPTSIFEERKYWNKLQMRQGVKKLSPFILKGKMFKGRERVAMVEQWFPHKRYGTHITEGKVKKRLRELRKAEYNARTSKEKSTYKNQKKLLEAFTGVRKY